MYLHTSHYVMFCVFLQTGWTALHCAASSGHSAAVDLLLNRQPNLITQTDYVSEQIIQFSIFIHDHTWIMIGVAGRVVMILQFKSLELIYP